MISNKSELERLVYNMYVDGSKSAPQIERLLRQKGIYLPRRTLSGWLKRWGIARSRSDAARLAIQPKYHITTEWLRALSAGKKMYDRQIAEHVGCSRSLITIYRKRYGIPTVAPWEKYNITPPSKEQKQVLLGTLLGDSGVYLTRRGKNAYLKLEHAQSQKDYLMWKVGVLSQYFVGKVATRVPRNHNHSSRQDSYQITSICHPFFTSLRAMIYPDGIKKISPRILNQIKPLGLAVWCMDDLAKSGKRPMLCTQGYTYEENEIIEKYLWLHWHLHCGIMRDSNGNWCIRFSTKGAKELRKIIWRHLHPTMCYKLANI